MDMRAVYTAITNGYDTLKEQPKADDVEFVVFTDNKDLKLVGEWQLAYVPDLNHKEPKILRHKYMGDYDQTLWIDANVTLKKGFENIFDTLKDNHIATFNATLWNTVEEETKKCVEAGYETEEKAERMREFLKKENYPDDRLSACTVILRDNDESLILLENRWMNAVKRFSNRDQFTYNYVMWRSKMEQDYFEGTVYDNKYLTWAQSHG